jgi:hypothetical protein
MGILDDILSKGKDLAKKEYEAAKTSLKFRLNMELERLYFSIPTKRELLEMAAFAAIQLIVNQLIKRQMNEAELKEAIRKNPRASTIIKYASNDLNNKYLSDMLLACYGESGEENMPVLDENLDANQAINYINSISDIDQKIDYEQIASITLAVAGIIANRKEIIEKFKSHLEGIKNLPENIEAQIKSGVDAEITQLKDSLQQLKEGIKERIETYTLILQDIIHKIKDLFTRTDHPSGYRTKYIQRLLRTVYGMMKSEYDTMTEEYKPLFQNFLNAFKNLDAVLITIVAFTSLYLYNRRKLAEYSKQTFNEIAGETACLSVPEAFDISINKVPFTINLNCPVNIDDVVVPYVPLSEKMKDLSCEIAEREMIVNDVVVKEDLATTAIIRNNRTKENFRIVVDKDTHVTQKSIIAILEGIQVFAPVEGYVDDISTNQIILRDISDTNDYLTEQIELLNTKYARLNDVKAFLKDDLINALYPSMLSIAIIDDTSTRNTNSRVDDEYKKIEKNYKKKIIKDYEKNIKDITGKDNVERHAKNETLNEIKEEVEKEQELFYRNIRLLNAEANNVAKKTKAKKEEYELFSYYMFDLGMVLNSLEYPTEIEITFRDQINEWIDKRYVLDGFNKNKLEDHLDNLIQNIEKGNSPGNWFKKALEVYHRKNNLEDLKNWLTNLADKNNKLDYNEKKVAVNKVTYLFEYYLNVNNRVAKYNTIKKETTSKDETIKEGNWLTIFFEDLWKEYYGLQSQIKDIEKIIDSLALFSPYSIITYKDKQARYYAIADVAKCEPAPEDEHLSPRSKYGYGDIRYWLKYCAGATLASCINPITGWSTGWITPVPIPFPVVYVPIKPIETKSGFILLGLTICGIYLFPMVLFGNFSTNYTLPFIDPIGLIKQEVDALKKEISEQITNLKKISLKPLMVETKKDIDRCIENINNYKQQIKENKSKKPSKYIDDKNGEFELGDIERGIQRNINYVDEYVKWTTRYTELAELVATEQIKLWKFQTKYRILQEAHDFGKPAEGISDSIDASQKFIDAQYASLTTIIDNANKLLATLPIAISPESANFGFTLKNPKPIINIAKELDDNVNDNVLNPIIEKFKLTNALTMSSNIENKLSKTIFNFKAYKTALLASMPLIITKDSFPKYELLTPLNLRWDEFLLKDFVTKGAQTYGFPGQLPLPISI